MIEKQAVVVTPQRDTVEKWISTILLQWEFVFVSIFLWMIIPLWPKERGDARRAHARPLGFQQSLLIHIYYNMI